MDSLLGSIYHLCLAIRESKVDLANIQADLTEFRT